MIYKEYINLRVLLEIQEKFNMQPFTLTEFRELAAPELDRVAIERAHIFEEQRRSSERGNYEVTLIKTAKQAQAYRDTPYNKTAVYSFSYYATAVNMLGNLIALGWLSSVEGEIKTYKMLLLGAKYLHLWTDRDWKKPRIPKKKEEADERFLVYTTSVQPRTKKHIEWDIKCTECPNYLECLVTTTYPDLEKCKLLTLVMIVDWSLPTKSGIYNATPAFYTPEKEKVTAFIEKYSKQTSEMLEQLEARKTGDRRWRLKESAIWRMHHKGGQDEKE